MEKKTSWTAKANIHDSKGERKTERELKDSGKRPRRLTTMNRGREREKERGRGGCLAGGRWMALFTITCEGVSVKLQGQIRGPAAALVWPDIDCLAH